MKKGKTGLNKREGIRVRASRETGDGDAGAGLGEDGEEPAILLCWGCAVHVCNEPANSGLGIELMYRDPCGPGAGQD